MDTVKLGVTGLEVTPIAYGTWQFGGDWGKVDEKAAVAAVQCAHRLGINFFDTAQAYGFGTSERILGRALSDRPRADRDAIVIATKGGLRIDEEKGLVRDSTPAWRRGVDESLANLGVDRIDLYQLHWPDPDTRFEETGEALRELVDEGKVRHAGASNFSVGQMAELGRTIRVETPAIAWTLANPAVQVAIVGARSLDHIEETVG